VRRAAPNDAKLLLIEALMPNEPGPSWTKTLDVLMLGLFGGRQRTGVEYRTILSDASFRLERILDIGAGFSILEASTA
jgi:O-methyltransferase domain